MMIIVPFNFLVQHPSHALFQTEDENLHFKLFCDTTARALSGYFGSVVWNRLMLQLCHKERFIAYAIVAIGALDKTIESNLSDGMEGSPSSRPKSHQHHEFALQQMIRLLNL
jgi:hypothetical protein